MTVMSEGGYDMHVHTDATDGRLRATEVIDLAADSGLSGMIFTDHSSVTWSPQLVEYAAGRDVDLPLPGMEISTHFEGMKFHVVLYGTALLDDRVERALSLPLLNKNLRYAAVIQRMRHAGLSVGEPHDILARGQHDDIDPPRKMLSRTLIALDIANRSQDLDFDTAYTLVANAERDTTVGRSLAQDYLAVERVLAIAEAAGLYASIAHPLWQCHDEGEVSRVIGVLESRVFSGVQGMETRSYHHRDLDDHPDLMAMIDRRGLQVIRGSDFHGNGKVELGANRLDCTSFAQLLPEVNK